MGASNSESLRIKAAADSTRAAAKRARAVEDSTRRVRRNPVTENIGRSGSSDDLSSRIKASGLISVNSHPELDVDTPLDKLTRFLYRAGGKLFPRLVQKSDSTGKSNGS